MHGLKPYSSRSRTRTPGKRLSEVLGSTSIVAAAIDNVLSTVNIKSKSHDTSCPRSLALFFQLRPSDFQRNSFLSSHGHVSRKIIRWIQIRGYPTKTPRSTVPSHTDPASPRFPIAVDISGDIRFQRWLGFQAAAPHRVQQMMMLHCSMHRARGLPSFGREIEAFAISELVYIRPVTATGSSDFNYVGKVEQIACRRGCGVNGGLRVTIFLACMRGSYKGISTMQSRHHGVAIMCRSDLLGCILSSIRLLSLVAD